MAWWLNKHRGRFGGKSSKCQVVCMNFRQANDGAVGRCSSFDRVRCRCLPLAQGQPHMQIMHANFCEFVFLHSPTPAKLYETPAKQERSNRKQKYRYLTPKQMPETYRPKCTNLPHKHEFPFKKDNFTKVI